MTLAPDDRQNKIKYHKDKIDGIWYAEFMIVDDEYDGFLVHMFLIEDDYSMTIHTNGCKWMEFSEYSINKMNYMVNKAYEGLLLKESGC